MTFGRGHTDPGQLVNWPSGVRRYRFICWRTLVHHKNKVCLFTIEGGWRVEGCYKLKCAPMVPPKPVLCEMSGAVRCCDVLSPVDHLLWIVSCLLPGELGQRGVTAKLSTIFREMFIIFGEGPYRTEGLLLVESAYWHSAKCFLVSRWKCILNKVYK